MIIHPRLTIFTILFTLRLSILSRIWARIVMATGLALIVTYAYRQGYEFDPLTVTPFSLIGVVLSIFLGFRTNASYDRFWEGRKLWGRFVNCTRTLTRQTELLVRRGNDRDAMREFRRAQAQLLAAYIYSVRDLLRKSDDDADMTRLLPDSSGPQYIAGRRNRPNALVQLISSRLGEAWDKGWIDDYTSGGWTRASRN